MFSDLGDNMFMFSFGLRDLADILRKVILLVYKKLHRRDVYADLSHCFQIPKPYRQYRWIGLRIICSALPSSENFRNFWENWCPLRNVRATGNP